MSGILEWSFSEWINKIRDIFWYLLRRWYLLILGCVAGVGISYFLYRNIKPTYTATISFVLSTESRSMGGVAGIAAQLGVDIGGNGQENVFSGDNIIELFKSNKMIKQALFSLPDPQSQQNLLNQIAFTQFSSYKSILPFPSDPKKFSMEQVKLFRKIIEYVGASFTVFKKDKRLVFYYISSTSEDEKLAYYISKCMLDQTSRFFIRTKTSAAVRNLKLLQKEADSLAMVLSNTFRSTASIADRTYNINPSLMVQRSAGQVNQSKAIAIGAAYTEVMRGLEMAKMNVQKETPLFSVIDETDLPIIPEKVNIVKRSIVMGLLGFVLFAFILSGYYIYTIITRPSSEK